MRSSDPDLDGRDGSTSSTRRAAFDRRASARRAANAPACRWRPRRKNCISTSRSSRRWKPTDSPSSARRCTCAATCAVTPISSASRARSWSAAYTAREARPPPPDLTQIPQAERRADPRRLVTPLVGLGVRAGAALAIWWVLAGSHGSSGASVESAAGQLRRPRQTIRFRRRAADGSVVPAGPAAQAAARQSRPRQAARSSRPPRPRTRSPSATQTRKRRRHRRATRACTLELTNDSWVEVYDSRGERLFYDVASAGSVQSIEGRPPAARGARQRRRRHRRRSTASAREIPASAVDGEGARFVVNRSGSLARAR